MSKRVLFDLDGKLLPMNQEEFTKAYFATLSATVAPLGYEPKALIQAIWSGTKSMVMNDGSTTNEEAFWCDFEKVFGSKVRKDIPHFDAYYGKGFQQAKSSCGYQPLTSQLIALFEGKEKPILATNPIFPHQATFSRIQWAGLQKEDFEYITTYENSTHCKPNPEYYKDIIEHCHLDPSQCLMVGNDTSEDIAALKTGMQVYIVTDTLVDTQHVDLTDIPHGTFEEMLTYVKEFLQN